MDARNLAGVLADKLRARIEADGPMPFEEYMAACLYDPDSGFFTAGPLRSVKEGDFLTSPEVSPWFGRTLARFVETVSAPRFSPRGGEKRPQGGEGGSSGGGDVEAADGGGFLVVDAGAGSGSLLRPLMSHIASPSGGGAERSEAEGVKALSQPRSDPPPGPDGPDSPLRGEQIEFHAIEASPAARKALSEFLGPEHVHDSVDGLPARFQGVVFANELIDNLPVALAIRRGDSWDERWVGNGDGGFEFVTAEARNDVVSWCDAYAGNVLEGGMVEVHLAADDWVRAVLERIDNGALVVIDYGGTAEELEPRRTQGTLRTYQRHHLGPDPLMEPGATDVTVDVNFTALMAAAEESGASVELHRQDDFLAELGLRDVVKELRRQELDLARGDDAMARLKVRSEMTDADTLLHPRGLGDFRVMVARREREN